MFAQCLVIFLGLLIPELLAQVGGGLSIINALHALQEFQRHPFNNRQYLGSEPSKLHYFPWLVSVHRVNDNVREFIGSGSIISQKFVMSSMDSFVRMSPSLRKPFYTDVNSLRVYSGGVWGTPYLHPGVPVPEWFQEFGVDEIAILNDPNTTKAALDKFTQTRVPNRLNDLKRSPFGLSMSICLLRMRNAGGGNRVEWAWKRNTLPTPLIANSAAAIQIELEPLWERYEKSPYETECYIGGWRLSDKRLVNHRVVYLPFEQCEAIYCAYDQEACLEWPVKDVHVCFKSMTFDELCWLDQGSAVYCDAVRKSVIAVLTSAPTCGYEGLPGVYTVVDKAMAVFEKASKDEGYTPVPFDQEHLYTPPPQSEMISAYR